jgi:transposase-like protein
MDQALPKTEPQRKKDDALQHEVKCLRQELKRVTEERDILKRPLHTLQERRTEVRLH